MIVLGIDPGIDSLGVMIVDTQRRACLFAVTLHTTTQDSPGKRIDSLAAQLLQLMTSLSVELVAYEDQDGAQVGQWAKDKTTIASMRVRDVVGAIRACAVASQLPCVTVTPKQAGAVVGCPIRVSREERKRFIQQGIQRQLAGIPARASQHACDGGTVAIAGEQIFRGAVASEQAKARIEQRRKEIAKIAAASKRTRILREAAGLS